MGVIRLRHRGSAPTSAILAAVLGVSGAALHGAEIVVDGTVCTLGDAIAAANSDSATGGCSAGSGADSIQLDTAVILTAGVTAAVAGGPTGLPSVISPLAIHARGGDCIERSPALACGRGEPTAFRLLHVASGGDLTLVGLTLRNGCIAPAAAPDDAAGGAILVESGASLELIDSSFDTNAALARLPPSGLPGSARGGALAVLGGQLAIQGGAFTANRAIGYEARGGAIHVADGLVSEMLGVVLSENHAEPLRSGSILLTLPSVGGGASMLATNVGTIAQCVFTANTAGGVDGGPAAGGGLRLDGGHLGVLRDSSFVANVARASSGSPLVGTDAYGGGLSNHGDIDSLLRVALIGNRALGNAGGGAARGGGIENQGWIGLIEAVTVADNVALGGAGTHLQYGIGRGGGIDSRGRIGRLVGSTLAGNSSRSGYDLVPDGEGGGLNVETEVRWPPVLVESTLMADNTTNTAGGSDCFAIAAIASAGFNLVEGPDTSCTFGAPGDVVGVDPQLLPPADNGCAIPLAGGACPPTKAYTAASPAVDQGRCSTTSSGLDARGALRPHDLVAVLEPPGGDGCDVGAFELEAVLPDVHVTTQVSESIDPVISGSGPDNLVYSVYLVSTGAQAAENVAVDIALTLPAGVALGAVTPSTGTWDGSTWALAALPPAFGAALTLELTVDAGTAGGTDVIAASAEVIAVDGHDGPLTVDIEATSVLQPIFTDGFESGTALAWSACLPAGPPC